MSNESNMRRVTAIRNGTVIDHIPAGSALRVLELLNIGQGTSVPVSLVMNVPSKKKGAKDIVKVEDRELTQAELDRLALVAEGASVAIIRAYTVAEKLEITLGDEITDVVRCTFSNCMALFSGPNSVDSSKPSPIFADFASCAIASTKSS